LVSHTEGRTQIKSVWEQCAGTFEPKTEEVAGGWRTLHNEELHNLYTTPNVIREIRSMRMTQGACSTHGRDEKCIQNFDRKT